MKRLIFIALLTLLAIFVVWPQKPGNYIPGGDALPGNPGIHIGNFVRQGAKLGLDLQGGTQLTLQADLSQIPADQQTTGMAQVNLAMKNIEQISRQNVLSLRQIEHAAQDLNALSTELGALSGAGDGASH